MSRVAAFRAECEEKQQVALAALNKDLATFDRVDMIRTCMFMRVWLFF